MSGTFVLLHPKGLIYYVCSTEYVGTCLDKKREELGPLEERVCAKPATVHLSASLKLGLLLQNWVLMLGW
jgi:hypothetical protein